MEEDKKKLEENMKYLKEREKGKLQSQSRNHNLSIDLNERVQTFETQKERQAQVIKDIKEKESGLIGINNDVSTKTKLLNMANQ
jgi:uncharacterized protein YtpQ (UPF0354 family)